MKQTVLFFLTFILAVSSTAQNTVTGLKYRAINDSYCANRCLLDIYTPADSAVSHPVIIWIHGGGLVGGDRFVPAELKDAGAVIVAVGHRLLPEVTVDSCIDDAAAAVAWTFRNIDGFGGDTKRIIVAGYSSGGYLAGMVGLDKSRLEKYGVDADSIAMIFSLSGQAVTSHAYRKMKGVSPLRPTIDETAPLYHVRGDAPEFIIVSADRNLELYGRYEENAYLARMLRLNGHKSVKLHELGGYSHSTVIAPALLLLKEAASQLQ